MNKTIRDLPKEVRYYLSDLEFKHGAEQIIEDTLVSALEGGSNYWAVVIDMKNKKPQREKPYLPTYITTPLSKDGVLILRDNEEDEGKVLELTREKIMQGIKVMAEKYPKHFGDMIAENGDAITGDVLLQCALFREVKYG